MSGPMYYWKCREVDCTNAVVVPNSLCHACAALSDNDRRARDAESDRVTRWALAGFGPLREYLAKWAAFQDEFPDPDPGVGSRP